MQGEDFLEAIDRICLEADELVLAIIVDDLDLVTEATLVRSRDSNARLGIEVVSSTRGIEY